MNHTVAKKVDETCLACCAELNKSIFVVMENDTHEAFQKYRDSVSKVLVLIYEEILKPVYQDHPDLKPTELD